MLLLGVPALLPLRIVCSRDYGNCFSCQPILKSSQNPTSAQVLLAAWHCSQRGVLQPWKWKAGSRNRNLGSVAGQESLQFTECSQWRRYMNAMLKKYLFAHCPVLCCWTGVLYNYPEQQSLSPHNHRVIRRRVCILKSCNSLASHRESRKRLKTMPTCCNYTSPFCSWGSSTILRLDIWIVSAGKSSSLPETCVCLTTCSVPTLPQHKGFTRMSRRRPAWLNSRRWKNSCISSVPWLGSRHASLGLRTFLVILWFGKKRMAVVVILH